MKKCMSIVFLTSLLGIAVCHLWLPDLSVSATERRRLAQTPELTWDGIWDGTWSEKIETYLLDQFPKRDSLRQLQVLTQQYAYQMSDVNGYYQIDDGIYEVAGKTQAAYIKYAGNGFADIAEQYFPDADIYYAVIPDKNYFMAEKNGYPSLDYEKIENTLQSSMDENNIKSKYIDLMKGDLLSIKDYYRTDLHWRQECIIPVAEYLTREMTQTEEEDYQRDYEVEQVSDSFAGAYLGASAFAVLPDTLQSVNSEELESCIIYDYEEGHTVPMYQIDKLEGVDAYDFYLGGARALLRIENPGVHNGRTLVLFRDSFGSSIAPLLTPCYEEIIMIDLRYVSMDYCAQQVTLPRDADVLFLYNADMINHGNSLRF